MNSEKQNTIFVTGSSSGLGRATAKLFASKGRKVIATMRNPNRSRPCWSKLWPRAASMWCSTMPAMVSLGRWRV
jgi:NAD(P)-dependent dehydrogenase (short-subunit alcohol dehydrogenase family)